MTCLLDASAVLAAVLAEPGGEAAFEAMADGAISVVNLCEVLSKLTGNGVAAEEAVALVGRFELRPLAFEPRHAVEAARLRPLTMRLGLSLGDRACLAHARLQAMPILTADRKWAGLDLGLDIRLIR